MNLSGYFALWGLSDNMYPFKRVSYLLNIRLKSRYSRRHRTEPPKVLATLKWQSEKHSLEYTDNRHLKPTAEERHTGSSLHMQMALGRGHGSFSRCNCGWNGLILSSEKFLKERKGAKGEAGRDGGREEGKEGRREGVEEGGRGGGGCFMEQEDKAGGILPISQRSSWVECHWSHGVVTEPQEGQSRGNSRMEKTESEASLEALVTCFRVGWGQGGGKLSWVHFPNVWDNAKNTQLPKLS